ncbi:flagellar export protein FliJ [Fervidibacillus halotolerans]|uniref:Flagellar FliJ protein n=1 Tax=Fervidibacillus halotolerans TaxID=2980027 RepID=A0A9E8M146_9BACI|nr:flagellar export protein FliJ [Fervidibacillus halotolerans]WAA13603.1 flagellar export protein FliJ [Fervidibacillus halotolerans]
MKFTYKFEKVLEIREKEKQEAIVSYQKSVDQFSKVAEKLYHLLKQKEIFEADQQEKIQEGISIQAIQLNQYYLSKLNREIDQCQKEVIIARTNMQREEKQLLEKNIEVKKLEILKEKEFERFLQFLNDEDGKMTDEISMQIVAREKTV